MILSALTSEDHVLGNPDAPVVVVEYTDLECPFCKVFHGTMKPIIEEYGESGHVAWVIRDFPLSQLHPNAPRLAEAAECVAELEGNEAYWGFIDAIFTLAPVNTLFDMSKLTQTATGVGVSATAFDACLESGRHKNGVAEEYGNAIASGGNGTPYNVIILKKELSKAGKDVIATLQSQLQPGLLTVSNDGKKIGLSGAQPLDLVKQVVDAALGQ